MGHCLGSWPSPGVSVCVCVCRLSSVACVSDAGLPGVSQIVGPVRLGLGACWRRLHHCVSLFVCYLSATCLLPAACCLLPACCLPCVAFFHRCIFSASCGNTFPTFYFTRVRAPRVFSAHLIFSHPPSRGRAAPNSTHSHVFSPCDSMTSSHLTSSLC